MNEGREYEVRSYVRPSGGAPFESWISKLRDRKAKAKIFVRIDRVRLGNFGDCRALGAGLHELRIDYGPGYRVYFGFERERIVLLLCGGDKGRQNRDIEQARGYLKEYQSHAHD